MDSIYKTNSDYVARTVSELAVIVPVSENCPKFNGMMKLNKSGLFLWNIFSKGCSVSEACDAVVEKYNISKKDAIEDVEKFIHQLSEYGLIYKIKDKYAK